MPVQKEKIKRLILWELLWFWIAVVGAYDLYRSVLDQETLMTFELNPIVRFIVGLSGGDISLFAGLKTFGTTVTLASLLRLRAYKHIWFILWSLAAVQFLVLFSYCPWHGLFG